jgi:hypothetical protein
MFTDAQQRTESRVSSDPSEVARLRQKLAAIQVMQFTETKINKMQIPYASEVVYCVLSSESSCCCIDSATVLQFAVTVEQTSVRRINGTAYN